MSASWPAEKEQRLRDLWDAGASYNEIAEAFGADVRGIQAKVYRLGLPRRYTPSQHTNPQFLAYRAEGRSAAYIAEKMGAGKSTVERWVGLALAAGGTERQVVWTPEADAELTRLWQRGLAPSAVGRQMRRSANAVSKRGRRLGLTPNRTYPATRKPAPPRTNRTDHLRLVARAVRPAVTDTLWDLTETSRPWLERAAGECAFPLGEQGSIHSRCAPVLHNDTYCEQHRIIAGGLRVPGQSFRSARPMAAAA